MRKGGKRNINVLVLAANKVSFRKVSKGKFLLHILYPLVFYVIASRGLIKMNGNGTHLIVLNARPCKTELNFQMLYSKCYKVKIKTNQI